VESYKLDMADRPYSITNLEGQAMSIDYGLGGLVKTVTRFDGTVVSNAYDNRGRLASQVLPDVANRLHYLANGLTSVLSHRANQQSPQPRHTMAAGLLLAPPLNLHADPLTPP
jgi:uncharacterized protein RhaS with RHS repeats